MKNLLVLNGKKCTIYILYFTIIMETLIAQFNFPPFIRYINDALLLLIVFRFMGLRFICIMHDRNGRLCVFACFLFFIVCMISGIANMVPIQLMLWASRNTFRGMIYFFAVITFLDKHELDKIMNSLYYIQFLHVFLASYQFFVLHHNMDGVGGIFGYGNGAAVNIFNALLLSFTVNGYLEKKVPFNKMFITILCSLYVAGIAEEKMTYVLFCVVMICSVLLSKLSIRKIRIILIGIVGLVLGLELLNQIYPDMFAIMTNMDKLFSYLSATYDEGYRLPRLGSFPIISQLFFNNLLNIYLGLGFGNCETSTIDFFNSSFYQAYGSWNYRWFTHQWTFLETGYIGFFSFVFFFVAVIICLLLLRKRYIMKMYNSTAITMVVCCIMTIWYNATLKTDMSYLAYFSMAIGFAAVNNQEAPYPYQYGMFKNKFLHIMWNNDDSVRRKKLSRKRGE